MKKELLIAGALLSATVAFAAAARYAMQEIEESATADRVIKAQRAPSAK